jgi:ankyrin repeat protein
MEDNLYFFIPKSKLDHYGSTLDSSENEVAQAISGEEGPLYGDDLIPNFDYIEKKGYNFPVFEPGDDFGIVVTWEITSGMCTDLYSGSFKEFRPYVEKLNEALMRAAESGNIDDAKVALENGAEIDNNTQSAGWTPLQRAASYGHFEMVKFLENNGANLHEGYSFAFRRAIANGHLEVADYLYKKGADVHHGNEEALHTAINRGRKEIVEFLIDRGADVSGTYDRLIPLIDISKKINELNQAENRLALWKRDLDEVIDYAKVGDYFGCIRNNDLWNEILNDHTDIYPFTRSFDEYDTEWFGSEDNQKLFISFVEKVIEREQAASIQQVALAVGDNASLKDAVDSLKKTDNSPKIQ